jgi:hypothetical protein
MHDGEMVLECWVIIIILGIAAYMFIRGHRKVWAGSVFPLMLVPLLNILYAPLDRKLSLTSHMAAFTDRIVMYAVAFIGVCVWVILWARKLPTGRSKYAYVVVSIIFTFLLILLLFRDLVLRPYFGI